MTEQQRAQELKELAEKLEQGIRTVFESGRMEEYLSAMGRMPTYSARNMALIFLQRPDAAQVMGYTAWKTQFGRQVNLGEKGIRILAPAPYKTVEWQDRDRDGTLYLDQAGNPKPRRVEITRIHYKAVGVFDVAQTSGRELPTLTSPLVGDVPDYANFFKALERSTSYPIEFKDLQDARRGYCSFVDKQIVIRSNQSELQTVKTAIHEITHARLHEQTYDPKSPGNRNRSEIEAEGTAFTVCQHFDLDTSEYSFGYIAGWSRGQSLDVLKATLDTIQRSAAELINEIDAHYAEILKEQPQIEEQKSPMQFASELIDYYEMYGTNQYHTVFGNQEKDLISNFALHNSDLDDIAQFIDIVATQQYELKNGYANPEMQAIADAAMRKDHRPTLDTPFLPPLEVLHETSIAGTISYEVYDRSTGSMFPVDSTDKDIFQITAVNMETGEDAVVGFSYEREFAFDAQAYTRTLFDLDAVQTGTQQLQFEGHPGFWQIDLTAPIRGDTYYLASNVHFDHLIVDQAGAAIADHVLENAEIVDIADFRAAVASVRADNMVAQVSKSSIENAAESPAPQCLQSGTLPVEKNVFYGKIDIKYNAAISENERAATIEMQPAAATEFYGSVQLRREDDRHGPTLYFDDKSKYQQVVNECQTVGCHFTETVISKEEYLQENEGALPDTDFYGKIEKLGANGEVLGTKYYKDEEMYKDQVRDSKDAGHRIKASQTTKEAYDQSIFVNLQHLIKEYAPPDVAQDVNQRTDSEISNIATVSELKAQVKVGKQISLLDLAAAVKAEQPRPTPATKKTSISEKLEKAARKSREQPREEKPNQPKREAVSL